MLYTVAIERAARHVLIGEGVIPRLSAALRTHIVDKEVATCALSFRMRSLTIECVLMEHVSACRMCSI